MEGDTRGRSNCRTTGNGAALRREISNCATELATVHREGSNLHTWHLGVDGGHMMPLRCAGEFVYGTCENDIFSVDVYPYSGGNYVQRIFGVEYSTRAGEDTPPDI